MLSIGRPEVMAAFDQNSLLQVMVLKYNNLIHALSLDIQYVYRCAAGDVRWWQHSAELEPPALRRPLGIGLVRAMVGIIKSRGDEGTNLELMQ